jgi:hypothetical protein
MDQVTAQVEEAVQVTTEDEVQTIEAVLHNLMGVQAMVNPPNQADVLPMDKEVLHVLLTPAGPRLREIVVVHPEEIRGTAAVLRVRTAVRDVTPPAVGPRTEDLAPLALAATQVVAVQDLEAAVVLHKTVHPTAVELQAGAALPEATQMGAHHRVAVVPRAAVLPKNQLPEVHEKEKGPGLKQVQTVNPSLPASIRLSGVF